MGNQPVKVTRLRIENFEGIVQLDTTFEGGVAIFKGDVGEGKTSVLEALEAALSNKGHRARFVHDGADFASVIVNLNNGIEAKRTYEPGDTAGKLEVTQDGKKVKNGQTILNALFNPISFRPLKFMDQTPKEQAQTLLSLTKVELSEQELRALVPEGFDIPATVLAAHPLMGLSMLQKSLEETRLAVGQDARRQRSAAEETATRIPAGFDAEAVRGTNLREKIDLQHQQRAHNETFVRVTGERSQTAMTITRLEEQLTQARTFLTQQDEWLSQNPTIDTQALDEEIASFQEKQSTLGLFDQWKATLDTADTLDEEYRMWGECINAVRAMPAKLMKNAELPVPGIGINENGEITVDDKPLADLSSGECLELAVQVAVATCGELQAVWVDGIEKLSPTRREEFIQKGLAMGFQWFMTQTQDGELIIEERAA